MMDSRNHMQLTDGILGWKRYQHTCCVKIWARNTSAIITKQALKLSHFLLPSWKGQDVSTPSTECCTQWSAALCWWGNNTHTQISLTGKVSFIAVYYLNQRETGPCIDKIVAASQLVWPACHTASAGTILEHVSTLSHILRNRRTQSLD